MQKPYFERAVMGSPQKGDFVHSMLPATRGAQFFHLLRTKLGKIFLSHLLTAVWFLPLLVWDYLCINYTSSAFGGDAVQSLKELPAYCLTVYGTGIIFWVIAFVGLSGGLYVLRRMAWGEPVAIFRDFFKGVKASGLQFALNGLLFSLLIAIFRFAYNWLSFYQAVAGFNFGYAVAQISAVVAIVLVAFVAVFASNLASLYKIGFFASWLAGAKLLFFKVLRTVGVLILSFVPMVVPFLFGSFIAKIVGYFIILAGGLGFAMLLWVMLSLSACDHKINQKDYPHNYLRGLAGGKSQSDEQNLLQTQLKNAKPTTAVEVESDFEVL